MNSEIVSDDCKPTRIDESTTTFRTTNVSVAQHFADLGVPDRFQLRRLRRLDLRRQKRSVYLFL
ncbi:hypothetical protein PILCRDRAFT_821606 [Piloderma croceum F 1598]|uniref:Uncharacterized protein n=1 Tax=Piloderma croceum (strain F 1598) TaxID=765440 RepID=A0A0C3B4P7_PILCF|nr:hypothetical protein PILCRDRAFT_821606 [Piloderma croceum F 1598]